MAKSAVSALFDLYNSIGASTFGGSTRPPIHLGEAPATNGSAAQLRPPYVVLYDESFTPEQFSAGAVEAGRIRIEAYALQLDAATGVTVDSIVRAIKFGGSAPTAKAGFDWGTLSFAAGSYLYAVSLRRTYEHHSYSGFTDKDGGRIHKCELRYECKIGLSPS